MYIVIVGAGDIGMYLAQKLKAGDHDVLLIEKDFARSQLVAEKLNVMVLNGDGTDLQTLKEARLDRAHTFVTLTSEDEVNIISAQIAKEEFKVERTVAKVNNPKNQKIFARLGVDVPIDSTSIIARIVEEEASFMDVMNLLSIKRGNLSVVRMILPEESPVLNTPIKNLILPKNTILVSVMRNDDVFVPNGETRLYYGDEIIAVTPIAQEKELMGYFLGRIKLK
jgi:trk system potassium uptake protein TrkA